MVNSSIRIDIEPANAIFCTYDIESHPLNMNPQLSLAGPGLIFYMSLRPLYTLLCVYMHAQLSLAGPGLIFYMSLRPLMYTTLSVYACTAI